MDWSTLLAKVKAVVRKHSLAVVIAALLVVLGASLWGIFQGATSQIGAKLTDRMLDKSAPAAVRPAINQIPPAPADFVGRETELAALHKAVTQDNVRVCIIRGMPGVGKTALALKFAEEIAKDYPDARFFVNLNGASDQPLAPGKAMEQVIHALSPEARLPDDETQLAGLYRSMLSSKRAIFLFDDARDASQVTPLIPVRGNLLIVTTRQTFSISGACLIDLNVLPPDKSAALLLEICPRIDTDADTAAKLCGYLPLALRLAGGALAARPDLRVEDYISTLTTQGQRLHTLDRWQRLSDAEKTIQQAFEASYSLLDNDLKRRWRMLSVFPSSFSRDAAASVWDIDSTAAETCLSDMRTFNLIEWNSGADRYRMHDLARDFATSRLAEDPQEEHTARLRHAAYYATLLNTVDDLYLQGGDKMLMGLALFDLERANIEAGFHCASENLSSDEGAAHLVSKYGNSGAYVLDLRQHPRTDRIPWLEACLAAACKLGDRESEGRHLGNLGIAYADLGDARKAIEYYEQRIAIAREIGDRRGEGADLGNLGNAYKNLGDARKAIEYHEGALAIAREIGDRRGEGAALGNLANAYAALGDARTAIEYYEKQLVIVREIGDRRGEGADLGNLGIAYKDLGDARKAIDYYEKALVMDREIGDRRGESITLYNMALAFDKLGRRAEAIPLAEDSLKIMEAIEDPHADAVRTTLAKWKSGE